MAQFYNLLQSVLILCLLILCTNWLKQRCIVSQVHAFAGNADAMMDGMIIGEFGACASPHLRTALPLRFCNDKSIRTLEMDLFMPIRGSRRGSRGALFLVLDNAAARIWATAR